MTKTEFIQKAVIASFAQNRVDMIRAGFSMKDNVELAVNTANYLEKNGYGFDELSLQESIELALEKAQSDGGFAVQFKK